MRKVLTYFSLFLLIHSSVRAQTDEAPSQINNTQTPAHKNIPGTHAFLVAPAEFTFSTRVPGFEHSDGRLIGVFEGMGANYYDKGLKFTPENFTKEGHTVLAFKEIKVNGYDGRYLSLKTKAGITSLNLVFGDSSFTTTITGVGKGDLTSIKAAILSIVHDKNWKPDPFQQAGFSLNDKLGRLKFFGYSGGAYSFTLDGKEDVQGSKNPMFLTLISPYQEEQMNLKELGNAILDVFKNQGVSELKITQTSSKKVNGYKAYEMEGTGRYSGVDCAVYVLVTTHGANAVLSQGIAYENLAENLAEFRTLARTITYK